MGCQLDKDIPKRSLAVTPLMPLPCIAENSGKHVVHHFGVRVMQQCNCPSRVKAVYEVVDGLVKILLWLWPSTAMEENMTK